MIHDDWNSVLVVASLWLSLRFLPLKEGGHQEQDVSVLSYIDLPNPPKSVFTSTIYLFPFDLTEGADPSLALEPAHPFWLL